MKNFYYLKHTVKKIKRQATCWEEIYAVYKSDHKVVYTLYKEHLILNKKKSNNQLKHRQCILIETSPVSDEKEQITDAYNYG